MEEEEEQEEQEVNTNNLYQHRHVLAEKLPRPVDTIYLMIKEISVTLSCMVAGFSCCSSHCQFLSNFRSNGEVRQFSNRPLRHTPCWKTKHYNLYRPITPELSVDSLCHR